jgi:hypothetical protein
MTKEDQLDLRWMGEYQPILFYSELKPNVTYRCILKDFFHPDIYTSGQIKWPVILLEGFEDNLFNVNNMIISFDYDQFKRMWVASRWTDADPTPTKPGLYDVEITFFKADSIRDLRYNHSLNFISRKFIEIYKGGGEDDTT